MRLALAIVLCSALVTSSPTAAQKVYKCPAAGGGHEYTNVPCGGDSAPLDVPDNASFGGNPRSAEMRLEQTNCIVIVAHPKATGWIANATNVARTATLQATFLARGDVRETATRRYIVPAFGRVPFDVIGPMRAGVDACDYSLTWD